MKTITSTIFLLTLFLFNSIIAQNSYELNGIIKGIPDSTTISILANNKTINSTTIINEKFQLKGTVNGPTNIFLIVGKEYKSFWLENKKIEFISDKDNLQSARIIGSETQKEDDLLNKRIAPFQKSIDSFNKILFAMPLEKRKPFFPDYNKITDKMHKEYKGFIKEFPNSLVSSHILNIYKTTWGKEESRNLFSLMNDERQNSETGNSIAEFIALNEILNIGDTYVDFEQENTKGKKIRLSDIKAKYTLIEFWASWCAPCRESNPKLVKTYNRYKDKGFEIIGVSFDLDKNSWLKAIEKDGLVWENVSELKGMESEAALIYGVSGIPDNILIDEKGKIIGRFLRDGQLEDKLEELFEE